MWQSGWHAASRHKAKANSARVVQHNTSEYQYSKNIYIFLFPYSLSSCLFLSAHLHNAMLHYLNSSSRALTVASTFLSVTSFDPKSIAPVHLFIMSVYSALIPLAVKLAQFDINPLNSFSCVITSSACLCGKWKIPHVAPASGTSLFILMWFRLPPTPSPLPLSPPPPFNLLFPVSINGGFRHPWACPTIALWYHSSLTLCDRWHY